MLSSPEDGKEEKTTGKEVKKEETTTEKAKEDKAVTEGKPAMEFR